MRILVDYRPALRARTGVGEYIHEIIRAYTAAPAAAPDQVTLFTSSWKDRPAAGTGAALRARIIDRRVPVRALNWLWHRSGWPPVEWFAGPTDVVHAAHPLVIPARSAAQVVTIHDLFFLSQPGTTRAEIRRDYGALTGTHARRADAIITSSRHVRTLVCERFRVEPERVYVCPPGAPVWPTLGSAPHLPPDGDILFVGTLEARKNVGMLLDAYARLTSHYPSVPRLVLVGAATPDAEPWLQRLARPPFCGRVEHLGYVAHEAREDTYRRARLLVLPSLDEGFGLPALEAMAAGLPVIVSNRGALPEVVGKAGVIVDPHDPDALASAMARLVFDPAWAANRARASLAQANTFTWAASVSTLRQAYLDAIARRHRRGRTPRRGADA